MQATPSAPPNPLLTEGMLAYQKGRSLDHCPGFRAALQVEGGKDRRIFAGLRIDGLEVFTESQNRFFFDHEGRVVRFDLPGLQGFRGLSHQATALRCRRIGRGVVRERVRLSASDLDRACREAWQTGGELQAALQAPGPLRHAAPTEETARAALGPLIDRLAGWTPGRLAAEAVRFEKVYQPIPILPPDHYASLVVQGTEGCSFDTCTFCTLYRDIPYRVRSPDAFRGHLEAVRAFHGEGLRRFTRIFLGQANALAAPQRRVVAWLEELRSEFELPAPGRVVHPSWALGGMDRFLGVGSFLDGFTGMRKTGEDYAELKALGLDRVYLGVESGSDELLRWVGKPAVTAEMRETLRRIQAGGLIGDVILMVGLGGERFADEQVRCSLDFLAGSGLPPGTRVYLSDLHAHEGSAYLRAMEAERIAPLDPPAMDSQRSRLRAGIRALGLQAVPYRIEPFCY
ncbi:MAG: radical SAM protein [Puniceicoccaceae bacterium]|nr:MAG: radical SAM protein [Puniceicoccaceae bacterium]